MWFDALGRRQDDIVCFEAFAQKTWSGARRKCLTHRYRFARITSAQNRMILGAKPAGPMRAFDSKFEIRFRTQRLKADGKGMVDDFDVEVRNNNLDCTCLVDELSGRPFVLVNEAVKLGIAIYNMRQGKGIR